MNNFDFEKNLNPKSFNKLKKMYIVSVNGNVLLIPAIQIQVEKSMGNEVKELYYKPYFIFNCYWWIAEKDSRALSVIGMILALVIACISWYISISK